ncbi:hypothetical protein OUZ56_029309 [Daphnia magna]|uniref:Glutamine amidotransferase domain-containing protein n=1 Tax=Daphnia magna TaxID=35525 RepID=A0ABR0B6G6_9CRUS|nr:hypothetical protein OUZ56_029309 [Daphnia magna]
MELVKLTSCRVFPPYSLVSEQCVESDMLALETPAALLPQRDYEAIIISGGPNSVYAADVQLYDPAIFTSGLPVPVNLLCMQLLNKELGGTVEKKDGHEDGQFEIQYPRTALAETPRGFNQPACDGMAALREVASISWRKFELDLQQDIVTFIFAPKPGLDDAS